MRDLNVLRVRQMLVFAAWEQFSPIDFARVLKLLVAVLFRYSHDDVGCSLDHFTGVGHDAVAAEAGRRALGKDVVPRQRCRSARSPTGSR